MTELSEDIHYLEINPENNSKSKDVKKRLNIFMKEGPLPRLYDAICEIRFDIVSSLPYATINKNGNRKHNFYKSKFKNNNINP